MNNENVNKLLTQIGISEEISNETNEATSKAKESLKENAQAKLNQKTSFEEYKKMIYSETEEA